MSEPLVQNAISSSKRCSVYRDASLSGIVGKGIKIFESDKK
jgi:hypothetical protein